MNINYFILKNIVQFSLATFMHYTNLCLCSSELDPKWTEKPLISSSKKWDFLIHIMPGVWCGKFSKLIGFCSLPLPSCSLLSERTSVPVSAAVWAVDLNSRRKQRVAHLQKQSSGPEQCSPWEWMGGYSLHAPYQHWPLITSFRERQDHFWICCVFRTWECPSAENCPGLLPGWGSEALSPTEILQWSFWLYTWGKSSMIRPKGCAQHHKPKEGYMSQIQTKKSDSSPMLSYLQYLQKNPSTKGLDALIQSSN